MSRGGYGGNAMHVQEWHTLVNQNEPIKCPLLFFLYFALQYYAVCGAMEYLGPGNEGVTPQAAAGILVERLKNAGDLGDRRDALDALLKLSQDHPTDVGHAGMPIFTDILQAGIADRSMTQTIMGIMRNLVKEEGANVSAFLKDVQNVQNLLDLLESTDALSALSAVQVRKDERPT